MTLSVFRQHKIANVCPETISPKSGFPFALCCRSTARVRLVRDGNVFAQLTGSELEHSQASGAVEESHA
jgi:hypothetical protein